MIRTSNLIRYFLLPVYAINLQVRPAPSLCGAARYHPVRFHIGLSSCIMLQLVFGVFFQLGVVNRAMFGCLYCAYHLIFLFALGHLKPNQKVLIMQ